MAFDGRIEELAAGAAAAEDYHYDHNNETYMVVLDGHPRVRDPDGEHRLDPGDVVLFVSGPEGARQLSNPGPEPARVLTMTTSYAPALRSYPDTETLRVTPPGGLYRPVAGSDPSATRASGS